MHRTGPWGCLLPWAHCTKHGVTAGQGGSRPFQNIPVSLVPTSPAGCTAEAAPPESDTHTAVPVGHELHNLYGEFTHTHTRPTPSLPVGHELQNLYEELPQAFPPHLALQLHLIAGGGKQGEPAGSMRPGPGPDMRVASASSPCPPPRRSPYQYRTSSPHSTSNRK